MATTSRRTDPAVADSLFAAGYRFDFFQAVRVLERLYSDRQPVGGDARPHQEVVRFHAHPSLGFPPSTIHAITPASWAQEPAQMTVAFMGLTGPLGVLPRHYTELLLARLRRQDRTLGDFLDLFHHRLLSLFYRAWEKHHVPIAYERAMVRNQEADCFSRSLLAWIGLGTAGLQNRLEVDDAALLFYAGLLAQHPRSASALTGLLQDYFGVRVEVVQFTGQWLPLTAEHRSCLGAVQGHNNALGVNTVLGNRVWDQQATFTLRLGPLTYPEFVQFLPTASAFRPLAQLTRFFAGQECDFAVQLVLKAAEVPWCRLGERGEGAPRLGWSTWLKTRECTHDRAETVLTASNL